MSEPTAKIFVDVTAQGPAQGKTLVAEMIRTMAKNADMPVTMVRIESERMDLALHKGDVHVATELLTRASETPGGALWGSSRTDLPRSGGRWRRAAW